MQILTLEQAKDFAWDIVAITRVWPHSEVPPIKVGKLVLNRSAASYVAEVEQAAFCPGNVVPGIAISPDKMLQARVFSYHDTHIHRLGPEYHVILINASTHAAEKSYQRDGLMQTGTDGRGGPNYWPDSFGGPWPEPRASEPAFDVGGSAQRHPYQHSNDDHVQAGSLYRTVISDQDRQDDRHYCRSSCRCTEAYPVGAGGHLLVAASARFLSYRQSSRQVD